MPSTVRESRRLTLVALGAVAAALLLGGCGDDGSSAVFSPQQAAELQGPLADLEGAVAVDSCSGARAAVTLFRDRVEAHAGTEGEVGELLRTGAVRLDELVDRDVCVASGPTGPNKPDVDPTTVPPVEEPPDETEDEKAAEKELKEQEKEAEEAEKEAEENDSGNSENAPGHLDDPNAVPPDGDDGSDSGEAGGIPEVPGSGGTGGTGPRRGGE